MIVRQIVGALLLALGLWLGWGTFEAFQAYTSRGAPVNDALVDPVFLLPGLRSAFAVLAGLLALVRWPGGVWLAIPATLLTGLIAGAILGSGGAMSLWLDDAIYFAVFLLLTCVLLLRQRTA